MRMAGQRFSGRLRREWAGLLLLSVALLFNLVFLSPEIRIAQVSLNDIPFHLAASERIVAGIARGEPFLEPWVSEWSLGYPVWRSYQPLPHLAAGLLMAVASPFVSHPATFAFWNFLLIALLPLAFYLGARGLGFSPVGAGLAALLCLAPSASGDFDRYGLSYGATTWRGSGLYTQIFALDLLLPTLGLLARALDTGRRRVAASVTLALTSLSHIVFGYVGFLTAGLFAVDGGTRDGRRRLARLAAVAGLALLLIAWFVVPLFPAKSEINRCRWEDAYKWNSFGAKVILGQLVSGDLLDAGRFPVLTILLAIGIIAAAVRWRERLPRRLLLLTVLWLALFFGRATWGPLVALAGIPRDFPMHRLQAAFELSAVLLAAWGAERAIAWIGRGHRTAGRVAAGALAFGLVAVGVDRAGYLRWNAVWGRENLAAYAAEKPDLDRALADVRGILAARPGRVSAGPAGTWGNKFRVGSTPVFAFVTRDHLDCVSFLYHSMSLTSDIMVLRDEASPAQNAALGIRAFLAPAADPPRIAARAIATRGPFRVYEGSREGYFGLVDVGSRYTGPEATDYDVNSAWLAGTACAAGVVAELRGPQLPGVPEFSAGQKMPPPPRGIAPRGAILSESKSGQTYRAVALATRGCDVFFKVTWFPGWTAEVDGRPERVLKVTPGFCAVPISAGRHEVVMRYRPGPLKPLLFAAGLLAFGLAVFRMRGSSGGGA